MAAPGEHKRVFVSCLSVCGFCLFIFVTFSWCFNLFSGQAHLQVRSQVDRAVVNHAIAVARGLTGISREFAERFDLPTLKSASIEIDRALADANKSQWKHAKRDLLGDLGNLFGGKSSSSSGSSDNLLSGLTGLLSGGTSTSSNSSSGLDGLLGNGISSLLSGLTGGLDNLAVSLGVGIGSGTAQGLNLSTAAAISAMASSAAVMNGAKPTGLNQLTTKFGSSLTAVVVPLVAKALPSNQTDLGQVAFTLAQGIGNGTSSGLKLTNKTFAPQNGSGLSALAGNLGLGISEPIAGSINISSLFSSAMSTSNLNLGQAVFSLAQGIGNGTSSALGLSKKAFSPSNGSDIASLAGNVGLGLSEPIVGSVNLSSVLSSAVSSSGQQSLMAQLPSILEGAGTGLGQGAAQGLGISKSTAQTSSGSSNGTVDLSGISELFTRSLSSSFLGSANLSSLTSGAGSLQDSLAAQLPDVASALGTGLGQGSAQGLGLTKASTSLAARATSSVDVPLIVQDFAKSLSSSFLSSANLSDITSGIGSQKLLSNFNINQVIEPAALGLGSGLGKGAAIGLGLQQANTTTSASSSSTIDVEAIASDFAQGLTESFLANGTLNNLMSESGGLFGNLTVNLGQVAEGLARGLVGGAADAVDGAGGLQNIIDGNISVNNVVANSSFGELAVSFNDSVGGAATGFGRGLGGEGVALVMSLLRNGTASLNQPATTTSSATTSSATTDKARKKRDNVPSVEITKLTSRGLTQSPGLAKSVHVKRAETGGLFSTINVTVIDSLLQKSSDAITCEGVGGLFGILSGLMESKTIPSNITSKGSVLNSSALGLPTTPITVENMGNKFTVDLQNVSISVNNLQVLKFIVLTALHSTFHSPPFITRTIYTNPETVLFVVVAYAFIYPIILSLEIVEQIAALTGRPLRTDKSKRWRKGLEYFAFFPLALIGTILGIVGMGSSGHFRTAHGVR